MASVHDERANALIQCSSSNQTHVAMTHLPAVNTQPVQAMEKAATHLADLLRCGRLL